MGRIQTDTGLITGVPITDTITKLMAIEAKPRDLLTSQNDGLKKQQSAITELSALLLSVEYITKNLGKSDLYARRSATSSNTSALGVTVTGTPSLGTYQFLPVQTVQSQQMLSAGVRSTTDALGGGKLSFRFGSTVARSASLDSLGGGQGFSRGKIRITDQSGATTDVDLSTARTIDDVITAINNAGTINVTAVADGDHLRLIDNTGQSNAHLKVQEVGGGTTAASLGLAGIDVAANVATYADGQDVVRLGDNTDLDTLNDGSGVSRSNVLPDIQYTLRDGTTGTIDLSPIAQNSSTVLKETTLGEVLKAINAQAPTKLKAEISAGGDRLVVTDLTSGSKTFEFQDINDSHAVHDLGLDTTVQGGNTITGRRILGGLKTVLLSSLGGGNGLGTLGTLRLTDRSGSTKDVDLSTAETLQDVIGRINAAGLGITAAVNQAGNGILLTDTTGATTSNLIAADTGDGTATKLGIGASSATGTINSGDLHLRVIARNSLLSDLNGGAGVARGRFTITDSKGTSAVLNLGTSMRTVGDVIDAINRLPTRVHADLNQTGDGIELVDLDHGSGTLAVTEGSSTTAHDLHLLGGATTQQRNNVATQVIRGSSTQTIELSSTDSLATLQKKINDLGAGVSATILSDGSNRPYRLSLVSNQSGNIGNLVFDASQLNLSLQETVHGQDALLALGNASTPGANLLASSSTNKFQNLLPGATLEVKSATGQPVSVTVNTSDTDLVASVKTFVDNYNKFRNRLKELTTYDTTTNTRATLTSDSSALRLDTDLSYLLSSSFSTAGSSIRSLADIGVTMQQDGTLSFDDTVLQDKYAADPDGVENLFTSKTVGLSDRFYGMIESIAGETNSMLTSRLQAITDKISANQQRIDTMTTRLNAEQERMYLKFYNMEVAVAKLKAAMTSLGSISYISLYGDSSTSSSSSSSN